MQPSPNPNYSLPDFSQETLVVHPCCSPRTHHTKKPSVFDFKYLPEAQMEQHQAASAALHHTDLCSILDLRSCLDVGQESSSRTFRWGWVGYSSCPHFLVLEVSLFGTGGSFGAGTQEGIFESLDFCFWKLVLPTLLKVVFFLY